MWNLAGYNSTHREATTLILLCGTCGFRIASPTQVPTFYTSKGWGTTIDLIWSNFKGSALIGGIHVLDKNFGLDHQALKGILNLGGYPKPTQWSKLKWKGPQTPSIMEGFRTLHQKTGPVRDMHKEAAEILEALQEAQQDLCRPVQDDPNQAKLWWDPAVLNPI